MNIPPLPPPGELPKPFLQPPAFQAVADNTRLKPAVQLPFETLQIQTAAPASQTEIAFVDGHAPLNLKLNPTQKQQLQDLLQRCPDLHAQFEQLASQPAGHPVLLAPDKQGRTVLEHLHQLASSSSRISGVQPAQVLREWIPRLADRQTIFQGPQYTCGSAAMQNWLTKNSPAELTRILTDLTLKGTARLQDRSSLSLPPDLGTYLHKRSTFRFNDGKDTDKRALCDVLWQSAVMEDISLVGGNRAWKGDPASPLDAGVKVFAWLTDWAGYDAEGDDNGLLSRLEGNGGGDPILLTSLMEAVTGQDFEMTTLLSGHDALEHKLTEIAARKQEGVVLYKSPLHYVLLKGYDPATRTVTCLSTGTYASKEEKIPLDRFLGNCGALILPR